MIEKAVSPSLLICEDFKTLLTITSLDIKLQFVAPLFNVPSHMNTLSVKEGLSISAYFIPEYSFWVLIIVFFPLAFADTEFKNYFQDFDQSIVDLFPNFIEEVNSLLQPEHRLTVKKGSLLCTELRILALIRLGITDSPKIARALNISVRTAYCYRNRLRYQAICPPEEFETRICEIGLYK